MKTKIVQITKDFDDKGKGKIQIHTKLQNDGKECFYTICFQKNYVLQEAENVYWYLVRIIA
jgi:hypothetical protein